MVNNGNHKHHYYSCHTLALFQHVITVVLELEQTSGLYTALIEEYGSHPDLANVFSTQEAIINGLHYDKTDPNDASLTIWEAVPHHECSKLHQLKAYSTYLSLQGKSNIDWMVITKQDFDEYRVGPHWYNI